MPHSSSLSSSPSAAAATTATAAPEKKIERNSKSKIILRVVIITWAALFCLIGMYSIRTASYKVTHKVYLDVEIDGTPGGRIVIGLFGEDVPRTSKNFLYLATGKMGISYVGSTFTRATKQFMIQGGKIQAPSENTNTTLYGKEFDDENFHVKHSRGIISMANKREKNTNGSEFFILTRRRRAAWLDGLHVAFGRVLDGMDVVEKIENIPSTNDFVLKKKVIITECGELH